MIPSSGVIVVADTSNHGIRLVTPLGVVTTLAGSGGSGYVDGAGAAASFSNPSGVAVIPSSGVIVVADKDNHRVRLVTPLGVVTTLAGGNAGYADGTGAAASFDMPWGVAVIPSSGVIVVADRNNHLVRLVTPLGVVTTLAGGFNTPWGVAVIPSSGLIVVTDIYNNRICLVDPSSGAVTTLAGSGSAAFADGTGTAASLNFPTGVAMIPLRGLIVVADYNNCRIRLVDPTSGAVTTLAGSGRPAFADGTGTAASLNTPQGVAVFPSSDLIVVADISNQRIRLLPLPVALPACDSTWHHIALTYSPLASPSTLSAFLDGALVFTLAPTVALPARSASTLRVGWSGDLATNSGSLFSGLLAELRVYNRSLSAAEVLALSQPPLLAVAHATISPPSPTLAAAAYTYSCDAGYGGAMATLARSAVDGAWAWAGSGATPSCAACGSAGLYSYGAPSCAPCAPGATFVSATASCTPSATLAAGPTDAALYLSGASAEGVGAFSRTGAVPILAAGPFGAAVGVGSGGALALASGSYLTAPGANAPAALPAGGNVAWSASAWVKCAAPATWAAVIEWGAVGDAQQIMTPQALALAVSAPVPLSSSAVVTTLAGSGAGYADGTGAAALFNQPYRVAVIPSSGVIAVADRGNQRIRLVTPLGVVTTLAGSGFAFFADGTGAAASFGQLSGVAVIPASSTIVVADTGNQRIRLVTTPLGVVTTLAGSGNAAFADGTGAAASFNEPWGVAVIPSSGVIVVADQLNHCIRLVTPLGVVTTLAGTGSAGYADGAGAGAAFTNPSDAAVIPSSGVIVVAEAYGNRIRLITPLGVVTTLAGLSSGFADGTGASASFNLPWGVAVIPSNGVILVADYNNHRVRLVSPLGVVTTLAGSGNNVFADGTGTSASFSYPRGVAFTPSGSIVVDDTNNHRVRLITLSTALPACDSTWHHIALTYSPSASPSTLSAFLDGALVFTLAPTITLPARASSTLRVGWSGNLTSNSGSLFSGSLSELRIYARALSAAEVLALSQPPLAPLLASLPNLATSPLFPSAGANSYAISCAVGYAAPKAMLARSAADGSFAWALGVAPSVCSLCPAGTFAAAGNTSCTPCPAGITTTAMSTGQGSVASCTTCAPGFFGAVVGAGTVGAFGCAACPAGIFTTGAAAGGAAVSACTICAPGFAGSVMGAGTAAAAGCSPCAAGRFSAAGAASCTSCPLGIGTAPGAAQTSVAACTVCAPGYAGAVASPGTASASGCSPCAPGSTPGPGATACAPCTAGSYASSSASPSCMPCPAGTWTTQRGQTSVSACTVSAPGYYGTVQSPGTLQAGGLSTCPVGSYSAAGASQCSACPPGVTTTNAQVAGACEVACTACAPGFFGALTSWSSGTSRAAGCTACSSGTFTIGSAIGSAIAAACSVCAPGYFGASAASCAPCPVGSSATTAGAAACALCAAGSYASSSGASACTSCPTGVTTAQAGSTSVYACSLCAPGFYGTVTSPGTAGAAGCAPCPPGAWTAGAGAPNSWANWPGLR